MRYHVCMSKDLSGYQDALNKRILDMTSACTQCGACVSACPMPAQSDVDASAPARLITEVTWALTNGIAVGTASPSGNALAWANVCSGTGNCISACPEQLNPRFMLSALRGLAKQTQPLEERRVSARSGFKRMARGVRVLSRLQLPKPLLERLSPSSHPERETPPDVVFYTGCNLLKTPHIGLLCLDVLDAMERSYEVHGGPSCCCGIYQTRAGDGENALRQGMRTLDQLAQVKASVVLSWCPTCQMQFSETMLPVRTAGSPSAPALASMTMFPVYLAEHLDELRPHLSIPVRKRVALYEHPGSPGVTDAVIELLSGIPGLEVLPLPVERFGYTLGSLSGVPEKRKQHIANVLRAAEEAGVDTLAGVYHSDHREIAAHDPHWSFEIINYMELLGASMGVEREDLYKRLNVMQDADAILADCSDLVDDYGIHPDEAREVIVMDILQDQFLVPDRSQHPPPVRS